MADSDTTEKWPWWYWTNTYTDTRIGTALSKGSHDQYYLHGYHGVSDLSSAGPRRHLKDVSSIRLCYDTTHRQTHTFPSLTFVASNIMGNGCYDMIRQKLLECKIVSAN